MRMRTGEDGGTGAGEGGGGQTVGALPLGNFINIHTRNTAKPSPCLHHTDLLPEILEHAFLPHSVVNFWRENC